MFENLNKDQLLSLLECVNFSQFQECLSNYNSVAGSHQLELADNASIMPSFLSPIIDGSIPIDIAWGLTSIITGEVACMAISIGFLGLAVIVAGVYFYLTYQEGKETIQELKDFFEFFYLKFKILSIIKNNNCNENDFIDFVNQIYSEQNKKISNISTKASIGVGLMTTFTLFCSMFLGVTSLVYTMGFVAVSLLLSGPVGIIVAAGLAVIAGIYLGYKHYQLNQKLKVIDSVKEEITFQFNHERNEIVKNRDKSYKIKRSLSCDDINKVLPRKETLAEYKRSDTQSFLLFSINRPVVSKDECLLLKERVIHDYGKSKPRIT